MPDNARGPEDTTTTKKRQGLCPHRAHVVMMVGVQKRVERDGRVRGAGFLKCLMKA